MPYDPLGYLDSPEFRIVETLLLTLTGAVLAGRVPEYLRHDAGSQRDARAGTLHPSRDRREPGTAGADISCPKRSCWRVWGPLLGSVVLFNAPRLLAWLTGRPLPFEVQEALRFDPSIVAICVGLCLVTSVVFGFLPATRFSRPVIISSLKDDAGVGGFQAGRVHRLTAALQVAIAVPLIVLSAIALDRVRVTATGDLGFESDLLYAAPLKFDGVADESVALRIRSVRDNLAKASGVASATVADGLPLDFGPAARGSRCRRTRTVAPRVVFVHDDTRR